jgi:hypothetical protein
MADLLSFKPGQAAFATGLVDPEAALPVGLRSPSGGPMHRRYAVYRNNVTTSLIEALGAIFPTVRNLVGETFFSGLAALYLRAHPPTSPLLFTYGATFADFIVDFTPAADLPYLADVARLERLWLDSYHAGDAAPLDPATLGGITADLLPRLRFAPHPALRIAAFRFSAVSIVSRDRSRSPLDGLNPHVPEWVLITRPDCDVQIRHLDRAATCLLGALADGVPLGEASSRAMAIDPALPLAALLQMAFEAGCFQSFILHEEQEK